MRMTKNRGCAFKVVDTGGVRYYTSPEVRGLRILPGVCMKTKGTGREPPPLAGRIAGAADSTAGNAGSRRNGGNR